MTRLVPPHLARAPEDPVTKMEACGFLLYTTPMYCVVTVCDTPVYPSVPLTTPSTVASRSEWSIVYGLRRLHDLLRR